MNSALVTVTCFIHKSLSSVLAALCLNTSPCSGMNVYLVLRFLDNGQVSKKSNERDVQCALTVSKNDLGIKSKLATLF